MRKRPRLALEMGSLGCVDPFELRLQEDPPGSGKFRLHPAQDAKANMGPALELERAGLCIAGCIQALMELSMRWFFESRAGILSDADGLDAPPSPGEMRLGEMRLVVRRREAKLLAALLRRHLNRLPEPPEWMGDLLRGIEEMDEFLRWQED